MPGQPGQEIRDRSQDRAAETGHEGQTAQTDQPKAKNFINICNFLVQKNFTNVFTNVKKTNIFTKFIILFDTYYLKRQDRTLLHFDTNFLKFKKIKLVIKLVKVVTS